MDFIILKVNGQDISSASHEEAVTAFRTAKEPILVEVLRRGGPMSPPGKSRVVQQVQSPVLVDTATQTEWIGGWGFMSQYPQILDENGFLPGMPPPPPELDALRDYHLDYEQILLQRSSNSDRLGLTLCYGTVDDIETEVFVGEVDPDSIAGKDGRIKKGDQIVKVNGVYVKTRDQAVHLFTGAGERILLTVARDRNSALDDFDDLDLPDPPNFPEDFLEEDHNLYIREEDEDLVEEIENDMEELLEEELEDGIGNEVSSPSSQIHDPHETHEKDSGVGRTDESTKNDESSEQDIGDQDGGLSPLSTTHRTKLNGFDQTQQQECDNSSTTVNSLNQGLSSIHITDDKQPVYANTVHITRPGSNTMPGVTTNQNSSSLKLGETLDKTEVVEQWVKSTNAANAERFEWEKDKRIRTTLNTDCRIKRGCTETTGSVSSAYNTGESCRSTPHGLMVELRTAGIGDSLLHLDTDCLDTPVMEDKGTQLTADMESEVYSVYSCDSCRQCLQLAGGHLNPSFIGSCNSIATNRCRSQRESRPQTTTTVPVTASRGSTSRSKSREKPRPNEHEKIRESPRREKNHSKDRSDRSDREGSRSSDSEKSRLPTLGTETMYTNPANLEHTIWLQQQMMRHALLLQQQNKFNMLQRPLPVCPEHGKKKDGRNGPGQEPQMEWKVKRRPDGSRFIARRPIRSKFLKERADRITAERSGLTTDDDAQSELKVGRYWPKEERKRHLEHAKAYRRRREEAMKFAQSAKSTEPQTSNRSEYDVESHIYEMPNPVYRLREPIRNGTPVNTNRQHLSPSHVPSSSPVDNIIELSQKKMMRRKANVIFDDFTTVQEVLAHGSRGNNVGMTKALGGLLSVTTV